MFKNFVKSISMLILVSVPQFSLRSEASATEMSDFESHLQPQDLVLMEQDEPMVYMSPDVIELIKTISSDAQEVKDLVDHIRMGYKIAPMKDLYVAIESAIKSCNHPVLKNYHNALLNGDALIRTEETNDRRHNKGKCGKFCTLFVQNCASLGSLDVKCNATISGDLFLGGTVRAGNFASTDTGCTTTSTFPNISACGNIQFNTSGTNTLNAQGAFESRMRIIRGTVSLTNPAILLTSAAPDTAVTVGGTLPTAMRVAGLGFDISGAVTGAGFSSGIAGTAAGTNVKYNFVVDLLIPINFDSAYLSRPSIYTTTENLNPVVSGIVTTRVTTNTATTVQASISNVTTTGAVINVSFSVLAQGDNTGAGTYANALTNAQNAINSIITNGVQNSLFVDFLAEGPVA